MFNFNSTIENFKNKVVEAGVTKYYGNPLVLIIFLVFIFILAAILLIYLDNKIGAYKSVILVSIFAAIGITLAVFAYEKMVIKYLDTKINGGNNKSLAYTIPAIQANQELAIPKPVIETNYNTPIDPFDELYKNQFN